MAVLGLWGLGGTRAFLEDLICSSLCFLYTIAGLIVLLKESIQGNNLEQPIVNSMASKKEDSVDC